jgi:hypothetical protein
MLNSETTLNFRGIIVTIEYEYSKHIPARMYESNGDPGDPEEGGEVYISKILHADDDITTLFDEEMIEEITNVLIPYINF